MEHVADRAIWKLAIGLVIIVGVMVLRPQQELVAQGHLVPASSVSIVDAACAALDGADPAERCRVALAEQDYVFIATALNGRCPSKYDGFERCACPPAPNDRFL